MTETYVAEALLCEALLPCPIDTLDTPEWQRWEETHILVHTALHKIVAELQDDPELIAALVEAVAA